MKKHILFAAIALAIASPAAAQTAPAQPNHGAHAQHAQHQGQAGHAQHGQHAQHAQHGQAQGSGQHAQHQGHAMQGDCCADRNNNGRMDCCENMPAGQSCCQQQQARPAQPNR